MLIPPPPKLANVIEILGPNRFRCSCCLRVNFKAWSDEEMLAEHVALHGADAPVPSELLCEDCYDVALLILRVAGQDNPRRRLSS
jgi:hypothetical protein